MMEEKTLKLIDPVTVAGKEYTELTIRKPRAKDLRGLKFGYHEVDADMILTAASRCVVGVLPAVVEELSLSDFAELATIIIDFLPAGLIPTGKQESGI